MKLCYFILKNRCGNSKGKFGIYCVIVFVSGMSCCGFCCGYVIVVVNVMVVLKCNIYIGFYYKWFCFKCFVNVGFGLIIIESV